MDSYSILFWLCTLDSKETGNEEMGLHPFLRLIALPLFKLLTSRRSLIPRFMRSVWMGEIRWNEWKEPKMSSHKNVWWHIYNILDEMPSLLCYSIKLFISKSAGKGSLWEKCFYWINGSDPWDLICLRYYHRLSMSLITIPNCK